jgi:hypothetical protein
MIAGGPEPPAGPATPNDHAGLNDFGTPAGVSRGVSVCYRPLKVT